VGGTLLRCLKGWSSEAGRKVASGGCFANALPWVCEASGSEAKEQQTFKFLISENFFEVQTVINTCHKLFVNMPLIISLLSPIPSVGTCFAAGFWGPR
jgi:hypothetical protein